jgi:hypothetical protein
MKLFVRDPVSALFDRTRRRDDRLEQETYVRIRENAGEFDPAKGSPMAWMATIARNRALDEVRRVRPASFQDLLGSFEPATDEIDPLASRERSEALSALLKCEGVSRGAKLSGFDRSLLRTRPTPSRWSRWGVLRPASRPGRRSLSAN